MDATADMSYMQALPERRRVGLFWLLLRIVLVVVTVQFATQLYFGCCLTAANAFDGSKNKYSAPKIKHILSVRELHDDGCPVAR